MSDDLLTPKYTDSDRRILDEMESRLNISRALVEARVALGMSCQDVAIYATTAYATVAAVEGADANPKLETLDRIARAVGLVVTLVPSKQPARHVAPSPSAEGAA